MRRYGWILAAAFAATTVPGAAFAQGSGLDINVSGNSVRAAYDTEITLSGLDLSFEGLHNSDHGSFADVGLGLRANANPGHSPVTALIGVKALWLNPDYKYGVTDESCVPSPTKSCPVSEGGATVDVSSGYALAIGGGVNYVLPSFNRLSFGGYIFWAPKVTSFSNATRFLEEEVRVGYRVLPNGTVYLGYRHVTASFENTDSLVLDNGINLGFALRF